MALPRRRLLVAAVLLAAAFPLLFLCPAEAGTVGVNYGRVANNLPSPAAVVQLLKQQGVAQVKLYDADPTVLRALANTGIKVVVSLPNEQLSAAASRASFALLWVRRNVAAYYPATQIHAIAVGNEVFVSAKNATAQLVTAMANVHTALARLGLDGAVKVSSPIALTALAASPPFSGSSRVASGRRMRLGVSWSRRSASWRRWARARVTTRRGMVEARRVAAGSEVASAVRGSSRIAGIGGGRDRRWARARGDSSRVPSTSLRDRRWARRSSRVASTSPRGRRWARARGDRRSSRVASTSPRDRRWARARGYRRSSRVASTSPRDRRWARARGDRRSSRVA